MQIDDTVVLREEPQAKTTAFWIADSPKSHVERTQSAVDFVSAPFPAAKGDTLPAILTLPVVKSTVGLRLGDAVQVRFTTDENFIADDCRGGVHTVIQFVRRDDLHRVAML